MREIVDEAGHPTAGAIEHGRAPLDTVLEIAAALGAAHVERDARALAERVADGRYYVACIGQFKRGKSTLLNALVGAPLLPTGIVPVTAVPTVIRHGPATQAFVRCRGDTGEWRGVAITDLADYVSEERNPANRREVEAVEIFTPSPLLSGGMCLVDTPGVGSVFEQNSNATLAFVPHIDAAIVVIGVDPPLANDELTLIEAVAARVPDVLVTLNKADRFSDAERTEAAEFSRRVLTARLGRTLPDPFHVSAARQLAGEPDGWDWPRLVAALVDLHTRSGRRLVRAAQTRGLAHLADQCLHELREQRAALTSPLAETEQRLSLLERYVAAAQRQAADLGALLAVEQQRLSATFADRCRQFLDRELPNATAAMADALGRGRTGFGPRFRERAYALARDIARTTLEPWLNAEQHAAEDAYRATAARFVDIADGYLARVAATGQRGLEHLPTSIASDASFRVPSRYFFRSLHTLATGSPLQWVRDTLRTEQALRSAVMRDITVYLENVLRMNCTLIANDLDERVLESRRRLEGEIQNTLQLVTATVRRALSQARTAHAAGSTAVADAVARLDVLERMMQTLL